MPQRAQRYRSSKRPAAARLDTRPPANQRGYDRAWLALVAQKKRATPYCEDCWERGIRCTVRLIGDHILPIRVRPDLRLDLRNVRILCRRCHGRKTDADKARYPAAYDGRHTPPRGTGVSPV